MKLRFCQMFALMAQACAFATGQAVAFGAAVGAAVCSVPVAQAADFSFSAADYAVGEALSQKGVTGAAWAPLPEGATATGVVESAVAAIDVSTPATNGLVLVADAPVDTNDFRQIDFSVNVAALSDGLNDAPCYSAALTPAKGDDGQFCFLGWGAGRWQELCAVGMPTNGWLDVRIELKTVAGVRYAGYLVKSGGDWLRLANAAGRRWFDTTFEGGECGASGRGRLASIAAASDPSAATTNFYWIGGAGGDWNATNNWSLAKGGAAAGRVPASANDAAVLAGSVEVVRGSEKAVLRDAVFSFGSEGSVEFLAGKIGGTPTLDTDRPLVGKSMTIATPTFLGYSADYSYRWYAGDYNRSSFDWESSGETFTPTAADYERWRRVVAFDDAAAVWTNEFYFSRLPVAYMTTDDGEMPGNDKAEHDGTIRIQGGERFGFQYDGEMVIKARGNTSLLHFEKKPYKIKLGKKTNLFDMGKNKHWVLLANSDDRTHLRNKLAYDLANAVGGLGMNSTWIVVFLNGDHRGLYQICEHIRPDKNRVPVTDWEDIADTPEQIAALNPSAEEIQNGYILEFSAEYDEVSKFITSAGKLQMKTMVNKPEYLCSNATMFAWVKAIMQDYWGACTSADRCVPSGKSYTRTGRHYSEFCDVDSMASFTLVNELFTNQDACQKSRYCYIENGKITWGPVWDFDHGSASSVICTSDQPRGVTNHWIAAQSANKNSMIAEWSADFYFCQKLHALYWKHRDLYSRLIAKGGDVDTHTNYIATAALTNDKRWSNSTRKFVADLGYLRRNLTDRLDWLDQQFSSVTNLIESFRSSAQSASSTWNPEATSEPMQDAEGRVVPAVPLEWVREANVGADQSFAYATEARLKTAVTNAPSAWGKATPLWQDYVAGTNPDPNGTNAVFAVTEFAITNGVPFIKWTPDLGTRRVYEIFGCENLGDDWHERTDGDRFFRVEVSMPE